MSDASFQNFLLKQLSTDDRALLDLELVDVALRQQFHEANAPVDALYFPEDCMASVVAQIGRGAIEVGLIGREGLLNQSFSSLPRVRDPDHGHFGDQWTGPAGRKAGKMAIDGVGPARAALSYHP